MKYPPEVLARIFPLSETTQPSFRNQSFLESLQFNMPIM